MRFLIKITVIVLICLFVQPVWAELELGKVPKTISLEGKKGGRLDGTPWSSAEFKDKIMTLFYVDPDEKDLNNEASDALKKEDFPPEKFQSYAIINMDATWLPNFAISASLEEKQKIYTTTIYVRDYKKELVKEWGLADNNSDVLVFDKSGKLIFRKDGKLNAEEIKTLIKTIKDHLED